MSFDQITFYSKKFLILSCLISLSCQSQIRDNDLRNVGGKCEGCEALYEYGDKFLNETDTIPGFKEYSPKIKIHGTIYKNDGVSPAEDIILYFYHTNQEGIYDNKGKTKNWIARHGIHRGWIKTDKSGHFEIYTFRPASYPNSIAPQHIHMTIKEPNTIPYYIDDIFFTDDPNFNSEFDKGNEARAGSGVITLKKNKGIWEARRDIYLGQNIPDY